MKILVKTFHGLEAVLADELRTLGAKEVKPGRRSASAQVDLEALYRINYQCRTALSVLMEIKKGRVTNEQSLYKLVQQIIWYDLFKVDRTFRVDVVCFSHHFNNTLYLAQLCKDAIVDQFRDRLGRRPNVSRTPNVRVNVYISGKDCVISLDTSGAALFKRGYRFHTGEAPINEVLAAGMIRLAGWSGAQSFFDPMCGSGTIPIEADLMSRQVPAQYFREEDFSFQHLRSFDEALWKRIKQDADGRIKAESGISIIGLDKDRMVLRHARQNARRAESETVTLQKQDFFAWIPEGEPPGLLIFNPPYDERLPLEDVERFYQSIGDHLKENFAGWTAWIISGHLEGLKKIGLRHTSKHTLFNGPLECKFLRFDLYDGSRKTST